MIKLEAKIETRAPKSDGTVDIERVVKYTGCVEHAYTEFDYFARSQGCHATLSIRVQPMNRWTIVGDTGAFPGRERKESRFPFALYTSSAQQCQALNVFRSVEVSYFQNAGDLCESYIVLGNLFETGKINLIAIAVASYMNTPYSIIYQCRRDRNDDLFFSLYTLLATHVCW